MSAKRRWMIGCGIGCGLAIAVVLAMGGAGYFFFQRISRQAEEISLIQAEMTSRFGPIEEHALAASGALPRDRVERFLAVREALLPARSDLEPQIDRLAERKKKDGRFGPIDMIALTGGIPRLVRSMLDYIGKRTDVLLAHDMSLGEYFYFYTVLYFSWLEHDPGDGPPFPLIVDTDEASAPPSWNRDEERVHRERTRLIRKTLHEMLVPLMERQLLEATAETQGSEAWRKQLAEELERLRGERSSLPWEEGPPGTGDLVDLTSRIEASYSPLLHPIEVGTSDVD